MKKNFFKKKLASALAIALVVASVYPAGISASAATALKIVDHGAKTATSTLYVGDTNKGKVNYDLSTQVSSTKYTWTISNSKVATIASNSGVVTAKAPGAATVKVTAKPKTGAAKTYTQKITVKQRATSLTAGKDVTVNMGETAKVTATAKPATTTDAVRFFSGDKTIATVNSVTGVVTPVAPGEVTINVYSKANASIANTSKGNKTATLKVTVVNAMLSAKQTEANVVNVNFGGSVADKTFKTTDFKIVNDITKAEYPVSSVSVDGKTVTLSTYSNMVDGKVYSVTYDSKTVQFTATDNTVADLGLTTVTVPYDTATEVKVSTLDANGVVLARQGITSNDDSKLEINVETTQGYVTDDQLVLFAIGNTATVKATYHTYKYDTNGNEIGAITKSFTVTAVDKTATTVKSYKYTIATSQPNWTTFTQNTKLAIQDSSYYFWFTGTKSDDSTIGSSDYTFASSNNDILLVNTVNGLQASVTAVNQGTAYVLVKDATTGAVVYSLPVNIVAKRVATNIVLGSTSVALSNSSTALDSSDVSVTQKDQYNDTFGTLNGSTDITVTPLSVPSGVVIGTVTDGSKYFAAGTDKVTFNGYSGSAVEPGTYVYRVSVGTLPQKTVTVNVAAPTLGATQTYKVLVSANTVDNAFDGSSSDPVNVTVKVAILTGGVLDGYANLSTVAVKNGTTAITSGTAAGQYSVAANTLTFHSLVVSGSAVTKADTGNYTVTLSGLAGLNGVSATSSFTIGFVVKDTQTGVAVVRSHNSVTASVVTGNDTATAVNVANAAYTFTYEGTTYDSTNSIVTATDFTKNGNVFYFRTLTINVPVGTYTVPVTVTVNSSVTNN